MNHQKTARRVFTKIKVGGSREQRRVAKIGAECGAQEQSEAKKRRRWRGWVDEEDMSLCG